MALVAGAAIGTLDAVIRRQKRWAGAWRQRLALAAAAVTARRTGRVEDEAALRDAVLLTKAGDDVGPAGRMLLAWRRLVTLPMEDLLTGKNLASVLGEFGHAPDDDEVSDLAEELRRLLAGGMVGMLTAPSSLPSDTVLAAPSAPGSPMLLSHSAWAGHTRFGCLVRR